MCENNFRKGVKAIIEEKGFKQKVIAEKSGIEPTAFSKKMTGNQRIFADEAARISQTLGYSFEEIMEKGKESA